MTPQAASWKEFRLHLSEPPRQTDHFVFIKSNLVPHINQQGFDKFLILNYFGTEQDMIRFRVKTDNTGFAKVRSFLNSLVTNHSIVRFEEEDWNPRTDASDRIDGARKRVEQLILGHEIYREWIVKGKNAQNMWFIPKGNYNRKLDQLTSIFADVVGKCTKAFYDALDEKPDDIWMISILIHLFLNSIDVSLQDERLVREFPAL